MIRYAQLDGILCVFMADSTNPIVGDNFIQVLPDDDFVGYNYINGEFILPVIEEVTPSEVE